MSRFHGYACALGVGLALVTPIADALETTISAQYRGGGSGRFENTTPPASFCRYWSSLCHTSTTVSLPITYTKRSTIRTPDVRNEYYFQLPGRREVEVYHEQTGESRRMTFDMVSVSQEVRTQNYYYFPLRGTLAGGCGGKHSSSSESTRTMVFRTELKNPQQPQPCWAVRNSIPTGYVDISEVLDMGVAYALDIPPPYRLRAGIYRGSVTYSIGPGGDFDFGNDVSALSGDSLTINFELDVQHAFLFEFPPGSDRAVLEPKGGWSAWLAGGKTPTRLYRDLPFRLWSTGPFKVYKLCQHYTGVRCGIVNDNQHQVAVEVALSLPGGIQHQGRPVEHLPLPSGRAAALQFDSLMPTHNRPGQLHFNVDKDDVRDMLAHAGSTYAGQVTVVFDAEL